MIIKAKIFNRDWKEEEKLEFKGEEAIDRLIEYLERKYGRLNTNPI